MNMKKWSDHILPQY